MIEVKAKTHINRLFATRTWTSDIFKAVVYFGFRGDIEDVPWWYSRHKGHSCVTDLTKNIDQILAEMKSNTRNEIRRAEREGCEFAVVETFDEFISMYNSFCRQKGLKDFVNEARMRKYPKVLVTKAVHRGRTMAMHSTILDDVGKISLLQFSCSPRLDINVDVKLVGWANRYLHFKDLEWLKSQGYTSYDWSGVCIDPQNPNYSIVKFKLSFVGESTINFDFPLRVSAGRR